MVLRALIPAVLTLAVGAGGAAATPTGGTPAVFVSAERASLLVGVDLTTGRVIARIRVPEGPHNVTSYSARYVLVTSPPAGAVTLVDAFSRRIIKTWRGFGSPHDIEVDGDYAYVTDESRGQLAVIDLTRRKVVAKVAVGPRPHDVAVGDVALVTHGSGQPELTIVDDSHPRRPKVLAELDVGGAAHDISDQGDSANAYVTYWNSGAVGAVDWGRRRMLWRRSVGTLVHHVQVDPYRGWRLWVTDHETGDLVLLSARNGLALRRLRGCPGAHHVALAGTAWVAVACHDADTLAVWNTKSWQRRLIRVGDGPHGVAEVVLP